MCLERRGRNRPAECRRARFQLGKEFTVRVVSFGDAISVSIDNQPIYFYRDARFDREAGYISIHGGLIPLTVRDVRIQELGDSMAFLDGTETIQQLNGQVKLAIELYTKESQVLEMLPDSVDVYDTAGKIWSVPVSWSAESYDRKQTGYHTFSGYSANCRTVCSTCSIFSRKRRYLYSRS